MKLQSAESEQASQPNCLLIEIFDDVLNDEDEPYLIYDTSIA